MWIRKPAYSSVTGSMSLRPRARGCAAGWHFRLIPGSRCALTRSSSRTIRKGSGAPCGSPEARTAPDRCTRAASTSRPVARGARAPDPPCMAPVAPLIHPLPSYADAAGDPCTQSQWRPPKRDSTRGSRAKHGSYRVWGRNALPQAPVLKCGCLPEPVKSAYGVAARWATPTLDRTRPTGAGSGAGDDEHQGDKPEPLAGSHAGSHTDERPCDSPDSRGRRTRTHPRSRTDPNGRGCLHRNLRIRRSRPPHTGPLAGH